MAVTPFIDIDLAALRHNLGIVRTTAPHARVLAVIKANAYGHGDQAIIEALQGADGVAVARLDEAVRLRASEYQKRILVLGVLAGRDDIELVLSNDLDITISHIDQLVFLERVPTGRAISVWIKVDTGMHRLGIQPSQVNSVLNRLETMLPHAELRLMTHFANADQTDRTATAAQISAFMAAALPSPKLETSLANSAAILAWPEAHADWVRPGIMLYGSSPFSGRSAESLGLLPVMTFQTQLIACNRYKRGDAIGYSGTWVCPEDMAVGVAAVGYGDGYPRHVPSGTPVLLNGSTVPLIGRVSMDMITLDLRQQPNAAVGDPVVLWGRGLPADRIAEAANTISYELFCGITERVTRNVIPMDC